MTTVELDADRRLRPFVAADADELYAAIEADRETLARWMPWASTQTRQGTTLAVAAMLDHGFGEWDLHRVELRAGVENAASRAVAERLGFTHEGVRRGAERIGDRWIDHAVYGLLAGEWRAGRPAR